MGTFDGPTCKIPWNNNGDSILHCNSDFQCNPNGTTDLEERVFCQKGKLLGFTDIIKIYNLKLLTLKIFKNQLEKDDSCQARQTIFIMQSLD